MALLLSDLSVLAYANNFTLWHYKTEDVSVEGVGYFDKGAEMFNVGDMMIANLDINGNAYTKVFIVISVKAGGVTVRMQ